MLNAILLAIIMTKLLEVDKGEKKNEWPSANKINDASHSTLQCWKC